LIEHAKKIENLEIDMKDVHAVCGVKGRAPVVDAALLAHFVTRILHVVIGKGNNALDNFAAELQAAAEGHAEEHCNTEKQEEVLAMKAHQDAKDDLAQLNTLTLECEKDMAQQWKRNDLSGADQVIVET
jgi:NAD(P)H-hydrate repair Nnr-like enzyme with NAD(P)H-hydrate epimerase domain